MDNDETRQDNTAADAGKEIPDDELAPNIVAAMRRLREAGTSRDRVRRGRIGG